jgi:beta-N-acetylhexosaminidase
MRTIEELAYGVLFPVLLDLALPDSILKFLDRGGKALLFGETGEEYKTGIMSPARRAAESIEGWQRTTSAARARADGLIAALDADISAVHRLQGLTPDLPRLAQAQMMPVDELERAVERVAIAAIDLGVTMFLSPTADVVETGNIWLDGRTLGLNIASVSRLVTAYVRGCQRGGIVSALKHFPGNPRLSAHPAMSADAAVPLTLDELGAYLPPFASGIAAGAEAVMMSPAMYRAVKPKAAGSISKDLIELLRTTLGFRGLVMTCDLDHPATMGSRGLPKTAVCALEAGADLLLISPNGVDQIPDIVAAITTAVQDKRLSEGRLRAAAQTVSAMAKRSPVRPESIRRRTSFGRSPLGT